MKQPIRTTYGVLDMAFCQVTFSPTRLDLPWRKRISIGFAPWNLEVGTKENNSMVDASFLFESGCRDVFFGGLCATEILVISQSDWPAFCKVAPQSWSPFRVSAPKRTTHGCNKKQATASGCNPTKINKAM